MSLCLDELGYIKYLYLIYFIEWPWTVLPNIGLTIHKWRANLVLVLNINSFKFAPYASICISSKYNMI